MPDLLSLLFPNLPASGIATLLGATLLGGLVRGFTGFGFAMVFMPLASLVIGPVAALGLIWVIDAPFALPLAARSAKRAEWSEVLPLLLTASLALPAGIALLTWLEPLTMRWLLAGLVLTAVALLASGWRYHGRPGIPLSLAVGSLSGLFNGLASLGGMPLAVFWLGAQRNDRHKTRANLQTYFGLSTTISGAVLFLKGIITMASALMALPLFAVYGAGLWIGTHGFRLASERTFRRIAYAVIFLSALVSLPLWDGLLGR
ncbi:sulfite exporter TauE/SafE family protein [Bosea caraganae]|uniref:Probable membrane transporter protein n=1 Tax=Bosea caraganae TaxID=2763117 RepID=A0A370KY15_9HYPH|nr:sulfite exporter TauE/SafE family protein [Bosea caraganae]RDJ19873.1 sulfite exporter TauE/SafE family protein [Bosea caraganae]RDJ25603.1 sulfite exporter TauE/SafE family protein [Bosea caraganae]